MMDRFGELLLLLEETLEIAKQTGENSNDDSFKP